jgi:quercetin dioxygenase-like cupin family protein
MGCERTPAKPAFARSAWNAILLRMGNPTVRCPGEGERHERSDGYRLVLVANEQVSVIEIGFDESLVVEPHTHRDHTDSFLVLEGEVEFTAGDENVVLGPGGFISSPPGARHGFRSAGGRAKVLNIHSPDGGFVDGIRRTTAGQSEP